MLVARYFGPEESVPYIIYTALGTTISAVAALGVDGTLLRYLPRITELQTGADQELQAMGVNSVRSFIRRLFALRMFVVMIVISIAAVVFLVFPIFSESYSLSLGSIREHAPYLLLFLLAQSVLAFSTFALIALLETKPLFFISLLTRVSILAIGIVLVNNGVLAVKTAILMHVLSAWIAAICLLLTLFRIVNNRFGADAKRSISYSVSKIGLDLSRLFLFRNLAALLVSPVMIYGLTTYGNDMLSAILGRQPDILMLRGFYGESSPEVGLYNVASMLLVVTEYIFFLGFGGALVSVFSKYAHEDEVEHSGNRTYPKLQKARSEIAGFQNITLIPLCGFMFVFALQVIRLIYGLNYDESVASFQVGLILLCCNVALFGGGLPITSLVAIGKPRLVLVSRITWGCTNVLANLILIKYYGVVGAIIGTNASNMLACATEDYFAKKYIGTSVRYLSMLRIVFLTCIVSCFIMYLDAQFSFTYSIFLRISLCGVLYFSILFSLFWLLKLPEFVHLQYRMRSILIKL